MHNNTQDEGRRRQKLLDDYDSLYNALLDTLSDNECNLLDKLLELERELTRFEE